MKKYSIPDGDNLVLPEENEEELLKRFQLSFGEEAEFREEIIKENGQCVRVELLNFLIAVPLQSTGTTFEEARLNILKKIFAEPKYKEITAQSLKELVKQTLKLKKTEVIIPCLVIEDEKTIKVLKNFSIRECVRNIFKGIVDMNSYRMKKGFKEKFDIITPDRNEITITI